MAETRHNRQRDRVPAPSGGWQVVYTGFILILLCFFIMLTSFASLEKSKITQFTHAFSSAVSVFGHGESLEEGETIMPSGAMMVDKEKAAAELFQTVIMLGVRSELNGVQIRRGRRGVVMTLSDTMLFSSGSADLSNRAYPLLNKIASIIKTVKKPVEIEGHTDSMPIHNRAFASNWELSTARAVNVLRYLTANNRADGLRLSAVGMAEYRPVAPNDSESDRAKNRRVEIVFKLD
jgi:chemotaxis protein MotB